MQAVKATATTKAVEFRVTASNLRKHIELTHAK